MKGLPFWQSCMWGASHYEPDETQNEAVTMTVKEFWDKSV